MLWYIPALLVLDKHNDTSLYPEIYDGVTVWERRGRRGFCWDVQIKEQGLTEKWECSAEDQVADSDLTRAG